MDLPRRRGRRAAPRRATSSRSAVAAARSLGPALFSDRSQIALRMLTYGEAPADDGARSARRSTRRSRSAESLQLDATAFRLVHGEADLLPSLIVDRYGDYLSCRRCRRAWIGCCRRSCRSAERRAAPARHPGAQRPASARRSRASSSASTCWHGEVPETRDGPEIGRRVRRGPAARPEDRAVPRPAREPGGRGAVRARTAARLLQLPRRLRAAAGAHGCTETIAFDVSEEAVARSRGRTPRATASPSTRAQATCSTNCAGSSASASGSTRSCSIRRRSRRTRPPSTNARAGLQGNQPARAEAAESRRHARHLQLLLQRRRGDVRRDRLRGGRRRRAHVTVVEKRMQGRDHPVLLGVPETYYLKCFILRKLA